MDETMTAVIAELKEAFEKFNEKHTFKPGDIVRWKPGMQNKRLDGPMIVAGLLADKMVDLDESAGSKYYREPLDLLVGIVEEDEFAVLHVDSRRFEPVE